MNGPDRLHHSKGLGGRLLSSARGDRAPAASRRRALAVAASLGVAATASTATASTLGATLFRAAIWKWVVGGMLAGAVVVGVEEAIPVFSQAPAASDPVVAAPVEDKAAVAPQRPTTPVATAAISASADPPIAAVSVHVAAPSAPTSPPVATVEAPPLESATAPKPEARTLVLEIAALDRVKRALVAGNMTSALEELNNYERDFPRGVMSPEAKAMRIEALARGGKKAEARAMLAAFRARHPDSPLLESLSRVVGE